MAAMLEKNTIEKQRSVGSFFFLAKRTQCEGFQKEIFLFTVGSVCRVKRFTAGSRNSLKDVRKSQMMPEQVRKWLRQQSKDFDALVKRWDNYIDVGGGYIEK
jgi:hypothetical protein